MFKQYITENFSIKILKIVVLIYGFLLYSMTSYVPKQMRSILYILILIY